MNKNGCATITFVSILLWTIILMAVGCLSCNSAKKAQKHYDIAKEANLVVVADNARKDFPCTTLKVDTIKGKDSVIVNEKIVPQYVTVTDTVIVEGRPVIQTKYKYVDCNCKDSIIYQPQFITKTVEDSAKVLVAKSETEKVKKDLSKSDKLKSVWKILALVFIGLFAFSLLLKYVFKI